MKNNKKNTPKLGMRVKVDGKTWQWFPTQHLTLDGKKKQIIFKDHEKNNN